ncbi:MAG: tetratricopeptide repeat protein [Bacteroidales bacterium]|nr:tetratricopeptide repeat protein [Bacteroidales bacterium]
MSNFKVLIFFFLLLFLQNPAGIFATEPDSLLKLLKGSKGKEKIDVFNQLAKYYYYIDPQLTVDYANKALSESGQIKFVPGQIEALIHSGIGYSLLGNNQNALENHLKALNLSGQYDENEILSKIHDELGIDYQYLGNYEKSLNHLLKSLVIKEAVPPEARTKDQQQAIANSLNNIGVVHDNMGNLDLALDFYLKAKELRLMLHDTKGLASVLQNIGVIYEQKGQYFKSLDYYEQALELKKEIGRKGSIAKTLNNIGIIYLDLENYPKALDYHLQALELSEEAGDSISFANTCNSISDIYLEMGEPQKAYPFIMKGLNMSKRINAKRILSDSYRFLAQYYNTINKYKKAFEIQQQLIALKDTLYNIEMTDQIAEMQTRYETEKKEQEIEILTKDNEIQSLRIRKQSTRLYLLISLVFIAGILGFLFFSRYKLKQKNYQSELEKKNLETEQRLLRAQMNPHFIFNSMNSIQSYISDNDSFTAMTYLSKFAQLMRYILENSRKSLISLEDEINTLQLYIELEKIRFKQTFDFKLEVDNGLHPASTYIPPMLIQPLVENAIKHGLRNKGSLGLLELGFTRKNGVLSCTVRDNGIGRKMAGEINRDRDKNHKSVGMQVTLERLEALSEKYRQKAGMEIQDLITNEGEASGTLVKINIPYETE